MAEKSRKCRKEEKPPITPVSVQNYYYVTELPAHVLLVIYVHTAEWARSLRWEHATHSRRQGAWLLTKPCVCVRVMNYTVCSD